MAFNPFEDENAITIFPCGSRMAFFSPRTVDQAVAFATPGHPYGVFIPGRSMTVGVGMALGKITTGDEFLTADACLSGAPSTIFCRRSEDRDALGDLLADFGATFTPFEAGQAA